METRVLPLIHYHSSLFFSKWNESLLSIYGYWCCVWDRSLAAVFRCQWVNGSDRNQLQSAMDLPSILIHHDWSRGLTSWLLFNRSSRLICLSKIQHWSIEALLIQRLICWHLTLYTMLVYWPQRCYRQRTIFPDKGNVTSFHYTSKDYRMQSKIMKYTAYSSSMRVHVCSLVTVDRKEVAILYHQRTGHSRLPKSHLYSLPPEASSTYNANPQHSAPHSRLLLAL
jgi:hypothetical protein